MKVLPKSLFRRFYVGLFICSFAGTWLFLSVVSSLFKKQPRPQSYFERKHVTTTTEATGQTTVEEQEAATVPYKTKPWDEPLRDCSDERASPTKKVAVVSASTPDFADFSDLTSRWQNSYAFYLPITVFAWLRIGYESFILVTGDSKPWFDKSSPLNLVRSIVQAHGARILFLETTDELKAGLAQVARLFAADMEPYRNEPDTYMLTSDVDILPIASHIYNFPPTADIHITDAWCCYVVAHRGKAYRMFPMATIGMRVSTWRTVMAYPGYSQKKNDVDRIWDTLLKEFGSKPSNMSRGVNGKWFFDQRLISYRIGLWRNANVKNRNCRLSLRKDRESPNEFRWIRAFWPPDDASKEMLLSANDAHGPPDAPITEEGFKQFLPLANLLTEKYDFNFSDYWNTFTKMMYKFHAKMKET